MSNLTGNRPAHTSEINSESWKALPNAALAELAEPTHRGRSPRLSDSSVLRELKLNTAEYHHKLETEAGIWPSLSSWIEYQNLMIRMFGIYRTLESRLKTVEELSLFLPDMSDRWKTESIRRDLIALNVPSNSAPVFKQRLDIRNVSEAFGCLYVLEGSTLGGQIISRQVQAKLGLTPEHGCEFFSSYGRAAGQMWKAFAERLEAFCSTYPLCRDEIVQSAVATFEYFIRCLAGEKVVVRSRHV